MPILREGWDPVSHHLTPALVTAYKEGQGLLSLSLKNLYLFSDPILFLKIKKKCVYGFV